MFISAFDVFKIGIGPSSSHTMGPMVAAARFLDLLRASRFSTAGVRVRLHGSLAFTGKGHATDRATLLGLCSIAPDTYETEAAEDALKTLHDTCTITADGLPPLHFDPTTDLIFDFGPPLPGHANGMTFEAMDNQGDVIITQIYYSIGGGFVVTDAELDQDTDPADHAGVPYPFATAEEMLQMAAQNGKSIAQMKRANEESQAAPQTVEDRLMRVWTVMANSIDQGLARDGILPGGLNVKRRAKGIYEALEAERGLNLTAPHTINDWISTYAMAVNEENAAGGQIVTSPTNGAAGVVPATLRYFLDHVPEASLKAVPDFLLTASAIGGLIKTGASISGAECGCQAEVGSASAMAAAGLCAVMGGTPAQVENAAEIALEHHLGMTCDPIKGLVQIPCIERNGLGAIKAVSAASLALRGDGGHIVPLDACIKTLKETGKDMHEKYKETALGGLAVHVPNC